MSLNRPDAPLVSIIINNYNYAHFIGYAIESALSQEYSNIEVVVVDDGSTDDSRATIASFGTRVHSVLKSNGGQASAFNAGFAASRGDVITLLDADDVFLPQKVSAIVAIIGDDSELGWCSHPLGTFDASEPNRVDCRASGTTALVDFRRPLRRGKLPTMLPATSGLSFRRDLLRRLLPMPEQIRITSDNYLKFAAAWLSRGCLLGDCLALQRLHGANAYTARRDVGKIRAEVQLRTAYWLRENFPGLRHFAGGLVADAVFALRDLSKVDSEILALIREFNRHSTALERLVLRLRLAKRSVRSSLHDD